MKVLFVCSGKEDSKISPIVWNQLLSLQRSGVEISNFVVSEKGLSGYFKHILKLRDYLKRNKFDVIHAHYSFCGFLATLAGARPVIVSLMGSDTQKTGISKFITSIFCKISWSEVIVKSAKMKEQIDIKKAYVIPNGVDFSKFKSIDKDVALARTGWDPAKKHILFAASPDRPEKNYALTKKAFDSLDIDNCQLHVLKEIPNDLIPYYYNAANLVMLTSIREGSPNVIKEAMACSRPIIVTDVGDVRKILKDTNHCHITNELNEIVAGMNQILNAGYLKTNGREKISWLNEEIIAKEIIKIYEKAYAHK